MTWRRATRTDLPQIDQILSAHPDQTMFLRGNLASDGLDTGAPRGMRIWWDGANLFGLSNAGAGFPMGLNAPDWTALRPLLAGEAVAGLLVPTCWLAGFRAAMGLTAPARHDAEEPHFALNLADLRMPDVEGFDLTPITEDQRAAAIVWRSHYLTEAMNEPASQASARAVRDIGDYSERDSHRLLWHAGRPVAMTGFNAVARTSVQIGGVYTPPDLRGRGYARRAVALHLAEARAGGATRSVLTAASDQAARAYIAIGYEKIGTFTFCIFDRPHPIA